MNLKLHLLFLVLSKIAVFKQSFLPSPLGVNPLESYQHVDSLRLTCQQCGKTFRTRQHLNRHATTHLPSYKRPYFICSFPGCGKKYTRQDSLQHHQRIHGLFKSTHADRHGNSSWINIAILTILWFYAHPKLKNTNLLL